MPYASKMASLLHIRSLTVGPGLSLTSAFCRAYYKLRTLSFRKRRISVTDLFMKKVNCLVDRCNIVSEKTAREVLGNFTTHFIRRGGEKYILISRNRV